MAVLLEERLPLRICIAPDIVSYRFSDAMIDRHGVDDAHFQAALGEEIRPDILISPPHWRGQVKWEYQVVDGAVEAHHRPDLDEPGLPRKHAALLLHDRVVDVGVAGARGLRD